MATFLRPITAMFLDEKELKKINLNQLGELVVQILKEDPESTFNITREYDNEMKLRPNLSIETYAEDVVDSFLDKL